MVCVFSGGTKGGARRERVRKKAFMAREGDQRERAKRRCNGGFDDEANRSASRRPLLRHSLRAHPPWTKLFEMRLLRAWEGERASAAGAGGGGRGALFLSFSLSLSLSLKFDRLERRERERGGKKKREASRQAPPAGAQRRWYPVALSRPRRPCEGCVPTGRSGWRGESACWLRVASKGREGRGWGEKVGERAARP